jgi:hypothetical protein
MTDKDVKPTELGRFLTETYSTANEQDAIDAINYLGRIARGEPSIRPGSHQGPSDRSLSAPAFWHYRFTMRFPSNVQVSNPFETRSSEDDHTLDI